MMMLSRGVRRQPRTYDPPRRRAGGYQPVHDRFYVPAAREWLAGWEAWQRGEHPDQQRDDPPTCSFEEWHGEGPDPDYHYPGEAWPAGAEMGIRMYETVTEGTPISAWHPDTGEGRRAMAAELAAPGNDTGLTSDLSAEDWLRIIEGVPLARDVRTGEIS
jgi:hypothetical protein